MNHAGRSVWWALVALVTLQIAGCPSGTSTLEYIAGGTGESALIRSTASMDVLTPAADLNITGGTQVEVNWRAFATSTYATFDVLIDQDKTLGNDNETTAFTGLSLTTNKALVDTTQLLQGTYYIVVRIQQLGQTVASGYAPGAITIDQRPQLYFVETSNSQNLASVYSARDNITFDRSDRVTVSLDVAWELIDPDSTDTVDIYLDPDQTANGNEVLLYRSTKVQDSSGFAADSFTFDLPTSTFAAGTYKILALVSDGKNQTPFYAPGSIRLRSRLAGPVDLRNLDLPDSGLQGAIFEGFNPRDNAGSFVSAAGDIDRDGFGDMMLVSQFGKPAFGVNADRTGPGEAYLVYGRSKRFSGVINLNSTGTLFRGEIYRGVPEVDNPIRPTRGITSFTVLTDWEGDGVREFAFGVPFTDSDISTIDIRRPGVPPTQVGLEQFGYFRTGGVIVVPGSLLEGFQGQNVFYLGRIGTYPVADTPHANCPDDGFLGPKAPTSTTGATLFYREYSQVVPPAYLGCRISTIGFGDQCGEMISSYPFYDEQTANLATAGGAPDLSALVISVPNRDPSRCTGSASVAGGGVVSIYFRPRGFNPWNVNDDYLPWGGPFHYVLDDSEWEPGYQIDPDHGTPCAYTDEWWTLPRRRQTTRLYGGFPGAAVGNAVAADDINADGIPDLLVGSPLSQDGAGASFIILGRLRSLIERGEIDLDELGLPMQSSDPATTRVFDGVRIIGAAGDRLGQAQASAGDFNADGIADVIIGSPLVNGRRGGAAVFFGSRDVINLTQSEIAFDSIATRGLGVIFVGESEGDLAGARVLGVGDVDGDGNDDILIAAPDRSVRLDIDGDGVIDIDRDQCGVVYLIYGSPALTGRLNLADVGTATLPGAVFIGRNSGDHLGAGLGLQGDRTRGIAGAGDVDGDGRADLLLSSVSASPRDCAAAGEVYLLYGVGD